MLVKLNRKLRQILIGVGALVLIFKLFGKKEKNETGDSEGFQTKEFDDIW